MHDSLPIPSATSAASEFAAARLILPVGEAGHRQLKLLERMGNVFPARTFDRCRFEPLLGRYGWRELPPA